jgi:hypothetical protein
VLDSKQKLFPLRGEVDMLSLYLDGGAAEQYALYLRLDTGSLSTTRNCKCLCKREHTGMWSRERLLASTLKVDI